jgi:hypothetical protein
MWHPAGRNGKPFCTARASEECAVAQIEPELAPVGADEVENGAGALVAGFAKSSAELLQEECGALSRPQHQDRVDRRDVDTFVEEVDGEDHADPSVGEVAQRSLPSLVGRFSRERNRGDAERVEGA